MKSETFFSVADKESISRTISEVESKTAGEVAVMVVDQSEEYPESLLLAGVALGGLISFGVTDYFFGDSLFRFLLIFLPCAGLCGWTVRFIPPVKRFFVPRSRLASQVRERAVRAFYEKGLYETRDKTGVLFFISLFEHTVWVLADKGIHEKIQQDKLDVYAADVAKGIKEGSAATSLCRAISEVGAILAEHFPVKSDDVNELSDEVMHE